MYSSILQGDRTEMDKDKLTSHHSNAAYTRESSSTVSSQENYTGDMVTQPNKTSHQLQAREIDCANIHEIVLDEKPIGRGTRKLTYLGTTGEGEKIALKVVDPVANDIQLAQLSLFKEILLLQQLDHPGILKLKGYCVINNRKPKSDTDPKKEGIIGVFERAEKFDIKSLSERKKIQTAFELADILDYLEDSPFGSFLMTDLRKDNFMFVEGRLKLTDADLLNAPEPECMGKQACVTWDPNASCRDWGCKLRVPCFMGQCQGYNAKLMIRMAHDKFFMELLQCDECPVKIRLEKLSARIPSLIVSKRGIDEINAKELKKELQTILANW